MGMVGEQVFFLKKIYVFTYFGGKGLHLKEKMRYLAVKKVANRAAPGGCGAHPLLPNWDQAPPPADPRSST